MWCLVKSSYSLLHHTRSPLPFQSLCGGGVFFIHTDVFSIKAAVSESCVVAAVAAVVLVVVVSPPVVISKWGAVVYGISRMTSPLDPKTTSRVTPDSLATFPFHCLSFQPHSSLSLQEQCKSAGSSAEEKHTLTHGCLQIHCKYWMLRHL